MQFATAVGGALVLRSDDEPEAIRKRLEIYEQTTSPLLQYYDKRRILNVLQASMSVEDVSRQVVAICLGK